MPTASSTGSKSIHEAVAEQVSKIAPVVKERVVNLLVEKEVNRRTELISQGLTRLSELDKENRKLSKPDHVTYSGDGTKSEVFSKDQFEQREKLHEKIDKLEKAIAKAIDNGDIGDLANLVNQK